MIVDALDPAVMPKMCLLWLTLIDGIWEISYRKEVIWWFLISLAMVYLPAARLAKSWSQFSHLSVALAIAKRIY
jgi:hypothetical protein